MGDPYDRIKNLEAELEAAHCEIARLSRDCVSGLAVRATFETHLERAFESRRQGDGAIGVVMVDIDHFKSVNDEHGHRVGDEVIAQVGRCLTAASRSMDLVARYGGEEFVIVTTDATVCGLTVLAERIRRYVEQMAVPGLPKVTVSVGFTVQREDDKSGWNIVERADHNLYRAKESGRNRVCHETLEGPEIDMVLEIEGARA